MSNILGDALKCDGMNIILVIGVMNEQARVKHPPSVEFNNRTCIKLPALCVLYKECAVSPYMTSQLFPPASFVSVITVQISENFVYGRFGVNVMFPLICVKFKSNFLPLPLFFFRISASIKTWSCISLRLTTSLMPVIFNSAEPVITPDCAVRLPVCLSLHLCVCSK